jgi:hypothetical protein
VDFEIVDDGKLHEVDDRIVDVLGDVEPTNEIDDIDGCSTLGSSDGEDCSTTSSIDNNVDCSCTSANDDSTSPSTSTHGHMDHCDMEVKVDGNVVDHAYTYDEIVDILKGMTLIVENLETKVTNLEHENLALKNSRKHTQHLLDMFVCKHETLKLTHEVLCQKHEELKEDHDFFTMSISKEEIKIDKSSSCELDG